MKNIFRFIRLLFGGLVPPKAGFIFAVFCLFTTPIPLHAQWTAINSGLTDNTVFALGVSDTNLFAGTFDGGVFRSTINGTSWTPVNTGSNNVVHTFAASGTNVFAGAGDGVFRSTDNGTSWTPASAGLTNPYVYALATSGTNLFAGTGFLSGDVVFRSANNGTSWTPASAGLPNTPNTYVNALAVSGTNLFAGTYDGVFRSTNNGTSWTPASTGLTNTYVRAFAVSGTALFAGTEGGLFRSTNNGTSWDSVNTGLTNTYVRALAVSGTSLFAGTYGGVFRSTNGTAWTEVNLGLTTTYVNALAVFGTKLFAGTADSGVWRRPLAEMITSVERLSTDLPTRFSLEQNYPNPFNPTTTIVYDLPKSSYVHLKLYDMLGRELATLVDGVREVGRYEMKFDATNFASGVYLYRFEAGDFVSTKKLVLMK